ncbi:MAG TPA: queuosine precursor transporter [bacterium]|nr:queuosine precursor transporter [bacterium]
MQGKSLTAYLYLAATFVAAMIAANVVATKIIVLGGLVAPAGVLAYSITFAVTDIVCETWGKERTQTIVRAGFVVQVLVWLLITLAVVVPPAPFWAEHQAAYASVLLGGTSRIIVASLIAYACSQTFDVWIFNRIKQATAGRHLWLRNNVGTALSQTLDTGLFITIAFYGKTDLMPLIGGQLLVKWIIALLDTPVVYAGVYLLRRLLQPPAAAQATA